MAAKTITKTEKPAPVSGKSSKTTGAEQKKFYKKSPFSKASTTVILILGIVLFGGIAVFTTFAVKSHLDALKASEDEYAYLRGLAEGTEHKLDADGMIQLSALDNEMRAINPDYVCWIRIGGTNIDYPVVRGPDNEKYLHTSFQGEENIAGAIFMDYRNIGERLPHIIIYGHNVRNGGMFTDLRKFLSSSFLEQNNKITLIVNDHEVEFEIFSARRTDVNDPAYDLNLSSSRNFGRFADRIGAPIRATQIITLSTCVSEGDDDARIIVQGFR
ncbi:MAG: class B sortase [Oscillospiraceae bacterium]|nr:class B sortase [Oscillospiraceae bacterium]